MNTMNVFTVENGYATSGATVKTYQISGGNIKIPAIVIGEAGRGRKLGVLLVTLSHDQYQMWPAQCDIRRAGWSAFRRR